MMYLIYIEREEDFLILFQYEKDAQAVLEVLKKRLGKFSLDAAEDKTRILPIGRYKGTKENFDFLGFTFYNTQTRGGKYRLGIRTSKKKLKNKQQEAKAWLKEQKNMPIVSTLKTLALVMRGHCNYYGISGNSKDIRSFHLYLIKATYRMPLAMIVSNFSASRVSRLYVEDTACYLICSGGLAAPFSPLQ